MSTLIEKLKTYSWMKNASPSERDDGSMIMYWENETGIDLDNVNWLCPKCNNRFERDELDGAHVVNAFTGNNHPQFIIPLCQTCNRSHDEKGFWVKNEYIVPAP